MVKVVMVNQCASEMTEIRTKEDDQEVHEVHLEVDSRDTVMLLIRNGKKGCLLLKTKKVDK